MDDVVRQAILAISDRSGGFITPQQVVEAATDKRSPLHPVIFRENDKEAAYERRLSIARTLIRSVRLEVQVTEIGPTRRVPVFVPSPDEDGYETLSHLSEDPDRARVAAVAEFAIAVRYLKRARAIAIELGFDGNLIDRTVAQLVGFEQQLAPREGRRPRR